MRVLHAVPAYFPSQGGIETLVRSIVRRLALEIDWETSILVPSYSFAASSEESSLKPWVERVDRVRVHRVPLNANPAALGLRETLQLFSWCRQILEQFQPDLVHSHGITLLTSPLSITTARLGRPLLWHLHGGLPENCPAVLLQLLRETPHLLAPSRFVCGDIMRAAGRTSPIGVLHNGIDVGECASCALGQSAERRDVVMVGRLEKEKGFDVGLSAVAPLLITHGAQLRILGTGPELKRLRELAVSLGVEDRVQFEGVLQHSQSLAAMARAAVVLVPSTGIEGFGLVAAEAGALGVPVVASRIGGLPEVVVDGQTGQLVNGGDVSALREAVRRYLESPDLAACHGLNAQAHVCDRFDLSTYVGSLVAIYRGLTGVKAPLPS